MSQEIENSALEFLANSIKSKYGLDLSEYAISSFKRRILRLLEVHNFPSVDEMVKKLLEDEKFYEQWVKDLTVNTTELFRDPSLWLALRKDLVPFLKKKDSVSVWHAACSSGEEVYSMAILLKECGMWEATNFFAADLNEDVINQAKMGKYPNRSLELYKSNYKDGGGEHSIENYMTLKDRSYMMDVNLLKNVVFQKFDLIQDKAPKKYDVIFVRNVLIYFNQDLQNRLIEMFYEHLNPKGYLILGSKETIAWSPMSVKFDVFNSQERIYRKI